MKNSFVASLLSFFAIGALSIANAASNLTLNPLASFGANGDGSIRPGDSVGSLIFDNGFNQRGMACDPVTTNIVLVDANSGQGGGASSSNGIFVLSGNLGNAATPATLSTNGVSGGSYFDVPVAIADDGVVFVVNQVNVSSNNAIKIYRYQSVSDPNPPIVALNATVTPSQRYGESIAIRGSGAGTQILLGSMLGTTATNVLLMTTTDGTNFTANSIGVTNVVTGGLGQFSEQGIAFGPSNTFWAKSITAPLRYLSYNLAAKTATILASYDNTAISGVRNLGPISVNTNLNILAAIEEANGVIGGGPERVWLFDISAGGLVAPNLLSVQSYTTNNQNATAPLGYLSFHTNGSRLYSHVVNNGMLAMSVDTLSTPLPIIDQQPTNPTNRVAAGSTAHFEVRAYPAITGYQWFTNGVPIPGANSFFLDVPNVQLADSGRIYSVNVINAAGTTTSANSTLSVVDPANLFHLNTMWSYAAGETNYMDNNSTTVPNVRNIAYNPVNNHLIVAWRNAGNVQMFIIDPNTGGVLYKMNTNGLLLAGTDLNIPICAVCVADDGAVYACSANSGTNSGIAAFNVYRWADDSTGSYPSNIYTGNPGVGVTTSTQFRWGDVMAVRGSGAGTQLIVDNQDTTTFRFAAVLKPSGADLNQTWTAKGFVLQNAEGGVTIGRSIQFGSAGTDTFWQKRYLAGGSGLVRSAFNLSDTDPALASVELDSTSGPFYTNGFCGINFTFNFAAAINFSGAPAGASGQDQLVLYDITAPESPVALNTVLFKQSPKNANNNAIGQILFATNNVLGTNYVFAIDANNAIMGLTLASGNLPPPKIIVQPKNQRLITGNPFTLSVVLDLPTSNQWQRDDGSGGYTNIPSATNTIFTLNIATNTDSGNYRMIAANSAGAVTSAPALVSVFLPGDIYSLTQVWATNSGYLDGVPPGTSTSPNERSFAYNSVSNQLLVVSNAQPTLVNNNVPVVNVINADTGAKLYTMSMTGVFIGTASELSGSNPFNLVSLAAADDGNIYACNLVPNASGGIAYADNKIFRVYRWTNSNPSTPAVQIFYGDPSTTARTNNGINLRFGDIMDVRGTGMNTEIIFDDQTQGIGVGILRPADATLNVWTNVPIATANGGGSIGRSLQFLAGNPGFVPPSMASSTNFWQKRKGAGLTLTGYDANTGAGTRLTNYANFPATLGGVAVDPVRALAIGVDYTGNGTSTPNQVGLYEISDPNTPMLVTRYNFPTTPNKANQNFISKTIISGNRVWSLDGNNGLVAFTINGPSLTITPDPSGKIIVTWPLFPGYTLQASPVIAPAPLTWTNLSSGVIVNGKYTVTNAPSAAALFYRLKK